MVDRQPDRGQPDSNEVPDIQGRHWTGALRIQRPSQPPQFGLSGRIWVRGDRSSFGVAVKCCVYMQEVFNILVFICICCLITMAVWTSHYGKWFGGKINLINNCKSKKIFFNLNKTIWMFSWTGCAELLQADKALFWGVTSCRRLEPFTFKIGTYIENTDFRVSFNLTMSLLSCCPFSTHESL